MKALVSVVFRTEEQGGRKTDLVSQGTYRPHLVVHGGKGEMLGVQFNETGTYPRGIRHVLEIEMLYDKVVEGNVFEPVDYGEVVPNAKFNVLEGSRIVAEGSVLAVSPPIKK